MNPKTVYLTQSGGTASSSIVTGGGCRWSVVSNVGWLSITSGTSGSSSGTLSLSINNNPGTSPRVGYVTVGNDISSALLNVVQSGPCTYALSEGTVSFPPGGGGSTVGIYTPQDCPWSAVPNSTWITITSGATGTATNNYPEGSFSLSAASNSQDVSLLGSVTVMNQTLNVVVGDPVGTPGTGSITVNGSPKYTYVCRSGCTSCTSKSCVTQVYENGTVGVSIGGDYYYANYSGTEGSSAIASALATAINAGSLVSASVSGSTVYLTARENGVNTNYSLVTSYSYNTSEFTSPAFTASASGSAMTGGTN
jgi:hypothetical protein